MANSDLHQADWPARIACVLRILCPLSAAVAFVYPATVGGAQAHGADLNAAPRISNVSARIARVYDEAHVKWKSRGVRGTYRLCDDGPQSTPQRFGLIRVTHRWGTRTLESLIVREQYPSISWDIYFRKFECRSGISWSSTIPADIPLVHNYPCYSVTLRVRDPGGRWSNAVTRVVKKCPGR